MNSIHQSSTTPGLQGPAVHALSNHLAVILGFIELVLTDTKADDPRRADLVEIRDAAMEAARIIGRPIDERVRETEGKVS